MKSKEWQKLFRENSLVREGKFIKPGKNSQVKKGDYIEDSIHGKVDIYHIDFKNKIIGLESKDGTSWEADFEDYNLYVKNGKLYLK